MLDTDSDSDENSTITGSDSESDSGETMRGKVTEKDPIDDKEEKCECNGPCKTHSCSCYKFGSGCSPSCACSGACANLFNHLDYFFGETVKCDANPCFAKWLIKNGNNEAALKSVDRDHLRQRFLNCDG